jgi:hypothetical protein
MLKQDEPQGFESQLFKVTDAEANNGFIIPFPMEKAAGGCVPTPVGTDLQ